MNRNTLLRQIKSKRSFLCIGLDSDIKKIPKHLLSAADPVWEFNKEIIDATSDLCVAYKPNLAFYESLGAKGFETLQKTLDHIPSEIFTIADAKRGDIGNTASLYAKTFFDDFGFDAVTVNPYMGKDSVEPFLAHKNKWTVLLALTSNRGSADFQMIKTGNRKVFELVLKRAGSWGNRDNTMFVVGATKAAMLKGIRKIIPRHFLLVPGVGAQGGSLKEVAKAGMNSEVGLLVNVSRDIIFAGSGKDFALKARAATLRYQKEMSEILDNKGIS